MKIFSIVSILALVLGTTPFVLAQSSDMPAEASSSLKYVEFSEMGNPADVLEVKVDNARALKSGEVRVKVLATPIHPSNLLQISGNYGIAPVLPSTPGSEGVGEVLETSAEATHLAVGQWVLLVGGGTWRDQIIAPASSFIPLPDLGTPSSQLIEQLSMTAVNPLTAFLMLASFVDLNEGDWIVHSAANSAVGGYIIQLAKQRGIKTVNVVRREGLAEDLMSKGGDVVLIDGPDLVAQIASATDSAPIALALDAVGGETFTRLAQSVSYGGTAVSYGVMSGKAVTLNPAMIIFNDLRIRGFWLSKWFETASMTEKQAAFGQIIPLIASGVLKANVDSRFTVSNIKQAVERAAQSGRDGKVLIVPNQQ
ncbi:MAG: zinc-dependent alcohol dehydrogenase family protein [Halioglobus sp.]